MKNIKEGKNKLTFKRMFYFYIIFSFIGCIYEEIYFMIKKYIKKGVLKYVTKRGVLYLELSPIYGIGACLLIYIFTRKKYKKSTYYWLGGLLGGLVEFSVSFFQELLTGTTSWNYEGQFLNIGGRTSILYMLVWGLFSYLLMTQVYPFISKTLDLIEENINEKLSNIVYIFLLIIVVADSFLSSSACIRMKLRDEGKKPYTFYGEFLDKYYPDERIKESYTNMRKRK